MSNDPLSNFARLFRTPVAGKSRDPRVPPPDTRGIPPWPNSDAGSVQGGWNPFSVSAAAPTTSLSTAQSFPASLAGTQDGLARDYMARMQVGRPEPPDTRGIPPWPNSDAGSVQGARNPFSVSAAAPTTSLHTAMPLPAIVQGTEDGTAREFMARMQAEEPEHFGIQDGPALEKLKKMIEDMDTSRKRKGRQRVIKEAVATPELRHLHYQSVIEFLAQDLINGLPSYKGKMRMIKERYIDYVEFYYGHLLPKEHYWLDETLKVTAVGFLKDTLERVVGKDGREKVSSTTLINWSDLLQAQIQRFAIDRQGQSCGFRLLTRDGLSETMEGACYNLVNKHKLERHPRKKDFWGRYEFRTLMQVMLEMTQDERRETGLQVYAMHLLEFGLALRSSSLLPDNSTYREQGKFPRLKDLIIYNRGRAKYEIDFDVNNFKGHNGAVGERKTYPLLPVKLSHNVIFDPCVVVAYLFISGAFKFKTIEELLDFDGDVLEYVDPERTVFLRCTSRGKTFSSELPLLPPTSRAAAANLQPYQRAAGIGGSPHAWRRNGGNTIAMALGTQAASEILNHHEALSVAQKFYSVGPQRYDLLAMVTGEDPHTQTADFQAVFKRLMYRSQAVNARLRITHPPDEPSAENEIAADSDDEASVAQSVSTTEQSATSSTHLRGGRSKRKKLTEKQVSQAQVQETVQEARDALEAGWNQLHPLIESFKPDDIDRHKNFKVKLHKAPILNTCDEKAPLVLQLTKIVDTLWANYMRAFALARGKIGKARDFEELRKLQEMPKGVSRVEREAAVESFSAPPEHLALAINKGKRKAVEPTESEEDSEPDEDDMRTSTPPESVAESSTSSRRPQKKRKTTTGTDSPADPLPTEANSREGTVESSSAPPERLASAVRKGKRKAVDLPPSDDQSEPDGDESVTESSTSGRPQKKRKTNQGSRYLSGPMGANKAHQGRVRAINALAEQNERRDIMVTMEEFDDPPGDTFDEENEEDWLKLSIDEMRVIWMRYIIEPALDQRKKREEKEQNKEGYKCPICPKLYGKDEFEASSDSRLLRHVESHSSDLGDNIQRTYLLPESAKEFYCIVCMKKYSDLRGTMKHWESRKDADHRRVFKMAGEGKSLISYLSHMLEAADKQSEKDLRQKMVDRARIIEECREWHDEFTERIRAKNSKK